MKHAELRPADLLLIGYGKRPLAIEFTVITPVRPSAALGPPGALMDSAARAKCRKYRKACDEEGWDFMPFVADTFGAVRSDARSFVGSIISRKTEAFAPLLPHEAGQAFWSAVTGAAVYRASSQLSRAASLDCPAEMPLALLDLASVRSLRANVNEAAGTPQPRSRDMGTSTPPLPSPVSMVASSPLAPGHLAEGAGGLLHSVSGAGISETAEVGDGVSRDLLPET